MKLVKEIYVFVLGIIVCFFVFQLANTGRFIGVFINRFSPCVQNPTSSFPCFRIYDIVAMGVAVVIGLILAMISLYKIIKFFKRSQPINKFMEQETQSQPQQLNPITPNNKNKIIVVVISLLFIVLMATAGYFIFSKRLTKLAETQFQSDETANWKTYMNTKYGFEFKYPENMIILGSEYYLDPQQIDEKIILDTPETKKLFDEKLSSRVGDFIVYIEQNPKGLSVAEFFSRSDTLISPEDIKDIKVGDNIPAYKIQVHKAFILHSVVIIPVNKSFIEITNFLDEAVFNRILSTFKFTDSDVTGQHCGGFLPNAPECPPGYTCQLSNIPDAGGTCVGNVAVDAVKVLPEEIQSNSVFTDWYKAKQKKYTDIDTFSRYLIMEHVAINKQKPYDGVVDCSYEEERVLISPDATKIACISYSLGLLDLSIYDKVKKISGVLQSCKTCSEPDGFWLDNDRFIFLSNYKDDEFQIYKEFIVVQEFDFSKDRSDSWSAGVKND